MNYEFKGSTINGAWYVGENFDGEPCVLQKEKGWSIGKTFIVEELNQDHFAEQDAHLIAAAPELLQSCIELDQVLRPLINNPAHEDVMTRLQQAIHKALNIQ